jgi:hypothetical protein
MILVSVVSGPIAAQTQDVIIPGAGSVGPWKTYVQLFNGSLAQVVVRLAADGYEQPDNPDCSAFICTGALDLVIPVHGLASAVLSDAVNSTPYGPWTFRVQLRDGPELPAVSARMYNTLDAAQSFEIPVVRADSLAARNLSALTFPDAIASGREGRSNLVIAAIGGDARVTVQGFTADGADIQSMTYAISAGTTLTVYDVFKNYLLGNGTPQIFVPLRATKVEGNGMIWGYLVSIDDQGGVSSEAGLNW